ncbi:MAG: GNAT family N-acetyltransferase [Ekhidna sp.]|nr:GNAT family N-acetyltransferase [Ekhidna sp.]MBC6408893.1 GNAT family N-acetyltransferase [Ekhidna sp.]MBC6426517.1 GNAT family N-acetyltransferase [Ekhidna sp.]
MKKLIVQVASSDHKIYAEEICKLIEMSAQQRGTGIAKRTPEYIRQKMEEGKSIIALTGNMLVGFCYIESWSNKKYVANSGLIVKHEFRSTGVATKIKRMAFTHSMELYPNAKLFGLTTSLPVMKINSELGYIPVIYSELTQDEEFWNGCKSCVNYEILTSKNKVNCICTAMLYDPAVKEKKHWNFVKKSKLYERFVEMKKKKLSNKKPVL